MEKGNEDKMVTLSEARLKELVAEGVTEGLIRGMERLGIGATGTAAVSESPIVTRDELPTSSKTSAAPLVGDIQQPPKESPRRHRAPRAPNGTPKTFIRYSIKHIQPPSYNLGTSSTYRAFKVSYEPVPDDPATNAAVKAVSAETMRSDFRKFWSELRHLPIKDFGVDDEEDAQYKSFCLAADTIAAGKTTLE